MGLVDQHVALARPAVDVGVGPVVVHRRRRRGAGRLVVKEDRVAPLVLERVPEAVGGKASICSVLNVWPVPFGSVSPPQFCRLYGCPELTSVPVESHITMTESNAGSSSAAIRQGAGHQPQKGSRSTIVPG